MKPILSFLALCAALVAVPVRAARPAVDYLALAREVADGECAARQASAAAWDGTTAKWGNAWLRLYDVSGDSTYLERAKTLAEHVRRLAGLDKSVIAVASTPEDWDGLRQAVASSSLEHRQEILAIIDDEALDPDAREWKIKSAYPADYRQMLDTFYPALRHSDYVVSYTVRPFSVEEAKEVLRTKPGQLSLEEMYLVAQTYEPGSQEFDDVFRTAVSLYPDDPTANLNAACAEIESGDYDSALRYLDKAGASPYVANARGVIALKRGDEAEARRQFAIAAQGGVKEAQHNLELLGE